MKPTTTLHTVEPATRWEDVLPLGNGSLGALVYGNICSETIVVNQETLWAETESPEVPDLSSALPETRALLKAGRWMEASKVMDRNDEEAGKAEDTPRPKEAKGGPPHGRDWATNETRRGRQ